MSEQNDSHIETAEDLAAEKDFTSPVLEDKVRAEIITEFGFDPNDETDKGRIDKAVQRELKGRSLLTKAVGQKINYRNRVNELSKPPAPENKGPTDVNSAVQAALDQRDLDDMPYPDELKTQIKRVAQINGVGPKKALSDPYIKSLVGTWEKDNGADANALGRRDNTSGNGRATGDDSIPPDVDMNTPEGRKQYDDWVRGEIAKGN